MHDPLVIHAPNVYQGGGKTLLTALLGALDDGARGHLQLDGRFDVPSSLPVGMIARAFPPTLAGRLRAESCLSQVATANSRILCFGSLPPMKRCRGRVSVFVQNRNIVGRTDVSDYPRKQRLRIAVERLWFRRFRKNADQFIVQTATMRDLLRRLLGPHGEIRIVPLVPEALLEPHPARAVTSGTAGKIHDFCYISTGEPHKNHRLLIEAWILLAQQRRFPSLCLTVSQASFPRLHGWIAGAKQRHGLNLHNVGYVPARRIDEIYASSRALIYPALYESFGLPLLEARRHGLRLVAAERDYVRDIVEPDVTFDPTSALSIARAVERFCHGANAHPSLVDGQEFIHQLLAA
jgi:glycosyltransferase involved in cell wall biosynthesis